MAVPRLRAPSVPSGGSLRRTAGLASEEVELYHRTYTTLLRSSGETRLRVLEPSHRAMGSSLHALAGSPELDLGAFLYAIRRLPDGIDVASLVEAEAPARRRRWYEGPDGTVAVLLASASDVDDLVPTLVAFQIEWNKIRQRQR